MYLYLNDNELEFLPYNFSNLNNLLYLYLDNNDISYFPNDIVSLENLIKLSFNNNLIITLPNNLYHLDNLSVNGSNIKVCIPVDSYSEEQLLAYVGEVIVKNQHMEHGIEGNKEHPYQRFHISCKDVEMDYYGYERLFNDFERDGVNSANDKYLEPTITNAVNEGYEEKTIMLLEK